MSDVLKTNELIVAKLRKAAKQAEWYQALDPKLLTAAADALKAATREQDSAGDIRRAVRLWSERFIPGDRWDTEDARDLDAALNCVVEANPDRSHARVPVQGEPNDDREVLAKQLRDIGAVRKVDQDCSCQDCEGAAEWVNAPLSVVLDHFKTNVSDAEPTHLVCAWCPQPARGDAWHNDGKLHPSCGQIDHGQGWVPPYTPRAAVPDAATEELLKRVEEAEAQSAEDRVEWQQMKERASQRFNAYQQKKRELRQMEIRAEKAEAERDASVAALERVRAIHAPEVVGIHEGYGEEVWCPTCKHHYPCPTVAALDGAPEPEPEPEEEMYQARCGSWDCRAPECGRA